MEEKKALEKVAAKILKKLGSFVDTVEPGKLSPQAMKHVTATLKDIRELTQEAHVDADTVIRVEFGGEEDWKN